MEPNEDLHDGVGISLGTPVGGRNILEKCMGMYGGGLLKLPIWIGKPHLFP